MEKRGIKYSSCLSKCPFDSACAIYVLNSTSILIAFTVLIMLVLVSTPDQFVVYDSAPADAENARFPCSSLALVAARNIWRSTNWARLERAHATLSRALA